MSGSPHNFTDSRYGRNPVSLRSVLDVFGSPALRSWSATIGENRPLKSGPEPLGCAVAGEPCGA